MLQEDDSVIGPYSKTGCMRTDNLFRIHQEGITVIIYSADQTSME